MIETGEARIVRREVDVLICRPQLAQAVAILHLPPDGVPDELLHFVRHLVVRSRDRTFDDYDRDTRRIAWVSEDLQNARIEFLRDEGWGTVRVADPPSARGHLEPAPRSVGFLMAVRRVPNPDRKSWPGWCHRVWGAQQDRPRIQISMGQWPRVWHRTCRNSEGVTGLSDRFDTRAAAEALKCRIEEGRDLPWLPRHD